MDFPCDNPCPACPPSIGGGIGPVDPANPYVNLSSEEADFDGYIGRRRVGGRPPLGSNWLASYCLGFCISSVSQADADLCAANAAVACLSDEWPDTIIDGGVTTTVPRTIYYSFPQYCAFTCPDGTEFRFTTSAGLFTTLDNQETCDAAAYSYACSQVLKNYVCLGSLSITRACLDASYYATVSSISVHSPITWTVTGDLPPGLALTYDTTNAIIAGTPTVAGDYSFTLIATDTLGNTMQKVYSISIFGISSTSPMPEGTVGTPYSEYVAVAGTPVGSLTWAVAAGVLPDGMTLDAATGELSGTPTTSGAYLLTISVTDES